MARKRFLDVCAYCQAPTWCETRQKTGQPQCFACKAERFFEALFAPIGFLLLPWHRKILRDLYGTVDADTGNRTYHRAYISTAKKNGKSFLIGGLPIYHLVAEHEINAEAYGIAAAREQAGIVFDSAAQLIQKNPALKDRLRVLKSTKTILKRDYSGKYCALSAEGGLQDGKAPSLLIIDELHRFTTAKAHTLYDVLTKGTVSRAQPLTVQITTAGEIYESPLCYAEHQYAEQILRGTLKSNRFYAAIWAADGERAKKEPEYSGSREARVAANPSHEDNGGFLKDERLVEDMERHVQQNQLHKWLRYNLNIWVESEQRAIDMAQWAACAGDWKAGDPGQDHELMQRFMNRPCYAGLDLSYTTDLTALALVFPAGEGFFDVLPFFWMAQDRVAERERKDRVPYSQWVREGYIEAGEGNVIDYALVKKRLKWAQECFDVREVAFDPYGATQLVTESEQGLQDMGFTCVAIGQGYRLLSEPTKKLLEVVAAGKLRHGGNPVLRWNADCLATKSDGYDNIRPVKPDRQTSSKRIDGIVATIMALSRAMVHEEWRSVYETRGPIFF